MSSMPSSSARPMRDVILRAASALGRPSPEIVLRAEMSLGGRSAGAADGGGLTEEAAAELARLLRGLALDAAASSERVAARVVAYTSGLLMSGPSAAIAAAVTHGRGSAGLADLLDALGEIAERVRRTLSSATARESLDATAVVLSPESTAGSVSSALQLLETLCGTLVTLLLLRRDADGESAALAAPRARLLHLACLSPDSSHQPQKLKTMVGGALVRALAALSAAAGAPLVAPSSTSGEGLPWLSLSVGEGGGASSSPDELSPAAALAVMAALGPAFEGDGATTPPSPPMLVWSAVVPLLALFWRYFAPHGGPSLPSAPGAGDVEAALTIVCEPAREALLRTCEWAARWCAHAEKSSAGEHGAPHVSLPRALLRVTSAAVVCGAALGGAVHGGAAHLNLLPRMLWPSIPLLQRSRVALLTASLLPPPTVLPAHTSASHASFVGPSYRPAPLYALRMLRDAFRDLPEARASSLQHLDCPAIVACAAHYLLAGANGMSGARSSAAPRSSSFFREESLEAAEGATLVAVTLLSTLLDDATRACGAIDDADEAISSTLRSLCTSGALALAVHAAQFSCGRLGAAPSHSAATMPSGVLCSAMGLQLVGLALRGARSVGATCCVGDGAVSHPALHLLGAEMPRSAAASIHAWELAKPAADAAASPPSAPSPALPSKGDFFNALCNSLEAPCNAPPGSSHAAAQCCRLAHACIVARELIFLVERTPPNLFAHQNHHGEGAGDAAAVAAAEAWRAAGLQFSIDDAGSSGSSSRRSRGGTLRTAAQRLMKALTSALSGAVWAAAGRSVPRSDRMSLTTAVNAVVEALVAACSSTAAVGAFISVGGLSALCTAFHEVLAPAELPTGAGTTLLGWGDGGRGGNSVNVNSSSSSSSSSSASSISHRGKTTVLSLSVGPTVPPLSSFTPGELKRGGQTTDIADVDPLLASIIGECGAALFTGVSPLPRVADLQHAALLDALFLAGSLVEALSAAAAAVARGEDVVSFGLASTVAESQLRLVCSARGDAAGIVLNGRDDASSSSSSSSSAVMTGAYDGVASALLPSLLPSVLREGHSLLRGASRALLRAASAAFLGHTAHVARVGCGVVGPRHASLVDAYRELLNAAATADGAISIATDGLIIRTPTRENNGMSRVSGDAAVHIPELPLGLARSRHSDAGGVGPFSELAASLALPAAVILRSIISGGAGAPHRLKVQGLSSLLGQVPGAHHNRLQNVGTEDTVSALAAHAAYLHDGTLAALECAATVPHLCAGLAAAGGVHALAAFLFSASTVTPVVAPTRLPSLLARAMRLYGILSRSSADVLRTTPGSATSAATALLMEQEDDSPLSIAPLCVFFSGAPLSHALAAAAEVGGSSYYWGRGATADESVINTETWAQSGEEKEATSLQRRLRVPLAAAQLCFDIASSVRGQDRMSRAPLIAACLTGGIFSALFELCRSACSALEVAASSSSRHEGKIDISSTAFGVLSLCADAVMELVHAPEGALALSAHAALPRSLMCAVPLLAAAAAKFQGNDDDATAAISGAALQNCVAALDTISSATSRSSANSHTSVLSTSTILGSMLPIIGGLGWGGGETPALVLRAAPIAWRLTSRLASFALVRHAQRVAFAAVASLSSSVSACAQLAVVEETAWTSLAAAFAAAGRRGDVPSSGIGGVGNSGTFPVPLRASLSLPISPFESAATGSRDSADVIDAEASWAHANSASALISGSSSLGGAIGVSASHIAWALRNFGVLLQTHAGSTGAAGLEVAARGAAMATSALISLATHVSHEARIVTAAHIAAERAHAVLSNARNDEHVNHLHALSQQGERTRLPASRALLAAEAAASIVSAAGAARGGQPSEGTEGALQCFLAAFMLLRAAVARCEIAFAAHAWDVWGPGSLGALPDIDVLNVAPFDAVSALAGEGGVVVPTATLAAALRTADAAVVTLEQLPLGGSFVCSPSRFERLRIEAMTTLARTASVCGPFVAATDITRQPLAAVSYLHAIVNSGLGGASAPSSLLLSAACEALACIAEGCAAVGVAAVHGEDGSGSLALLRVLRGEGAAAGGGDTAAAPVPASVGSSDAAPACARALHAILSGGGSGVLALLQSGTVGRSGHAVEATLSPPQRSSLVRSGVHSSALLVEGHRRHDAAAWLLTGFLPALHIFMAEHDAVRGGCFSGTKGPSAAARARALRSCGGLLSLVQPILTDFSDAATMSSVSAPLLPDVSLLAGWAIRGADAVLRELLLHTSPQDGNMKPADASVVLPLRLHAHGSCERALLVTAAVLISLFPSALSATHELGPHAHAIAVSGIQLRLAHCVYRLALEHSGPIRVGGRGLGVNGADSDDEADLEDDHVHGKGISDKWEGPNSLATRNGPFDGVGERLGVMLLPLLGATAALQPAWAGGFSTISTVWSGSSHQRRPAAGWVSRATTPISREVLAVLLRIPDISSTRGTSSPSATAFSSSLSNGLGGGAVFESMLLSKAIASATHATTLMRDATGALLAAVMAGDTPDAYAAAGACGGASAAIQWLGLLLHTLPSPREVLLVPASTLHDGASVPFAAASSNGGPWPHLLRSSLAVIAYRALLASVDAACSLLSAVATIGAFRGGAPRSSKIGATTAAATTVPTQQPRRSGSVPPPSSRLSRSSATVITSTASVATSLHPRGSRGDSSRNHPRGGASEAPSRTGHAALSVGTHKSWQQQQQQHSHTHHRHHQAHHASHAVCSRETALVLQDACATAAVLASLALPAINTLSSTVALLLAEENALAAAVARPSARIPPPPGKSFWRPSGAPPPPPVEEGAPRGTAAAVHSPPPFHPVVAAAAAAVQATRNGGGSHHGGSVSGGAQSVVGGGAVGADAGSLAGTEAGRALTRISAAAWRVAQECVPSDLYALGLQEGGGSTVGGGVALNAACFPWLLLASLSSTLAQGIAGAMAPKGSSQAALFTTWRGGAGDVMLHLWVHVLEPGSDFLSRAMPGRAPEGSCSTSLAPRIAAALDTAREQCRSMLTGICERVLDSVTTGIAPGGGTRLSADATHSLLARTADALPPPGCMAWVLRAAAALASAPSPSSSVGGPLALSSAAGWGPSSHGASIPLKSDSGASTVWDALVLRRGAAVTASTARDTHMVARLALALWLAALGQHQIRQGAQDAHAAALAAATASGGGAQATASPSTRGGISITPQPHAVHLRHHLHAHHHHHALVQTLEELGAQCSKEKVHIEALPMPTGPTRARGAATGRAVTAATALALSALLTPPPPSVIADAVGPVRSELFEALMPSYATEGLLQALLLAVEVLGPQ